MLDEHDAHLAAAAELAPTAAKFQFEGQELLRCPRVEEVEVDCHSLRLESHWDYHELIQPSET